MATRAHATFPAPPPILLTLAIAVMCVGVTAASKARPASPAASPHASVLTSDVLPLYEAKFARLQDDGSTGLARRRLAGEKAPSSLRAIVLMCDFADSAFYGRPQLGPDDPATSTQRDFYYATHDSLYYAHQMRDVADYFAAVSGGQFTWRYDVAGTIVHLPAPMAAYGNDPVDGERSVELAADVVAAIDPLVDFSAYDTVVLIHAGAGEETDILDNSPEQIYSTYLGPEDFAAAVEDSILATPYIPTDDLPPGGGIRNVLVLPENEFQDPYGSFAGFFGSLGVYCFEVGLRLGMLSLSDFTPAGHPDSQGIGEFGLMGYGLFVGAGFIPPHPIAFNKLLMGWIAPESVDPDAGTVTALGPAENTGSPESTARIDITGREYWLLEYRLQDPDGNGIFSFTGDLNGNNIPDFYDADSATGDGRPSGFFDPATDQREWLTGAEWDFFMSENTARAPGVKGAGSGIYVWHVDEGVIESAFGAASNLFNADASRKSVDLEEADGIQDLDSREPSPWLLGGDDDSFRGEGAAAFGPQTRPATDTAGGAATGIVIDGISNVVSDSTHVFHAGTDSAYTGIEYASQMSFRCARQALTGSVPQRQQSFVLAGIDMAGAQPLVADLDQDDAGQEVLAISRDGAVVVYDPPSPGPVVRYVSAGGDTVRLHQIAAAGRLEGATGGGALDILVSSDRGLHWLRYQAGDVVPQGTDPLGLLTTGLDCPISPVMWPVDGSTSGDFDATAPAYVWTCDRQPSGDRLVRASTTDVDQSIAVAAGRVAGPLVVADGRLFVTVADTAAGNGSLLVLDLQDPVGTSAGVSLPLVPGVLPAAVTGLDQDYAVSVVDSMGQGTTVWLDRQTLQESRPLQLWSADMSVQSPLGPDLALVAEGSFGRVTAQGAWQIGWPASPLITVQPARELARAAMPLAVGGGTLFVSRDGRMYHYSHSGVLSMGWPLAGPGESAGTPVVADVDGDGTSEIAAWGAFGRIVGVQDDGSALVTQPHSEFVVFGPVATAAGPAMWGGNPWRAASFAATVTPPGGGARPLVAGSHFCYPNPVTGETVSVRGAAGEAGQARAWIYNLEGEKVAASTWQTVIAGMPFEIAIPLGRIASGLYVCRLEVRGDGGASDTSVKTVAVVR